MNEVEDYIFPSDDWDNTDSNNYETNGKSTEKLTSINYLSKKTRCNTLSNGNCDSYNYISWDALYSRLEMYLDTKRIFISDPSTVYRKREPITLESTRSFSSKTDTTSDLPSVTKRKRSEFSLNISKNSIYKRRMREGAISATFEDEITGNLEMKMFKHNLDSDNGKKNSEFSSFKNISMREVDEEQKESFREPEILN